MVGDDPHGWWACLEGVPDPEIPVISIVELGVVRDIRQGEHGIDVDLSPTYTGCPAMDMMAEDVQKSLAEKTGQQVQVHLVIDPPWTTDWLSESTKDKLRAYGIAPPVGSTSDKRELFGPPAQVSCPKMSKRSNRTGFCLWVYRMQVPLPMPGLPGALRLFQMSLRV